MVTSQRTGLRGAGSSAVHETLHSLVSMKKRKNEVAHSTLPFCKHRVAALRRRPVNTTAYASLTGLLLLFVACQPTGLVSEHTALGQDGVPLRAAFNADQGKVRVMMLVSPT